jgi:hypothetical protein
VSDLTRHRALEAAGLLHPHPEGVTAPLFVAGGLFLPLDKVQVKYEMLRAHLVQGVSATEAAQMRLSCRFRGS